MSLGTRLHSLRKERGYSREKAAALLGVSFSALEKWETGKRRPTRLKAKQLADFYGLTVSELVGDTLTFKEEKKQKTNLVQKYSRILAALEKMDETMVWELTERIEAMVPLFPAKKQSASPAPV
jgi:transcriptional regulator with XRE-family HTH domain